VDNTNHEDAVARMLDRVERVLKHERDAVSPAQRAAPHNEHDSHDAERATDAPPRRRAGPEPMPEREEGAPGRRPRVQDLIGRPAQRNEERRAVFTDLLDLDREPIADSTQELIAQSPPPAERTREAVAESTAEPATEATVEPAAELKRQPYPDPEGTGMTRRLTTRLGQLLLDRHLLSEAQLEASLAKQRETGERLGALIVNEGHIDEPTLLGVLAEQYGVPAIDVDAANIEPSVAKLIPHDMALRYLLVPMGISDGAIDVAMVDPTDFVAMAHVRFATGRRPNVFITTATAAQRALAQIYADETGRIEVEEPELDARVSIKKMILDRDSMLIAADQDPRKFYELAVTIEEFVDEILRKARG
jgi:hypothetical protein